MSASVEVRVFATLTDLTGWTVRRFDVRPGESVADLWGRLVEAHPALGVLGYRPAVARDRKYGDWDDPLDGVAEVAFLPPVSGG